LLEKVEALNGGSMRVTPKQFRSLTSRSRRPAHGCGMAVVSNMQLDFLRTPCNGVPVPGATIVAEAALYRGGRLTLQNNHSEFSGISFADCRYWQV